jgi:hypothetical protein
MPAPTSIKIVKRGERLIVNAPLSLWQSLGLLQGREDDRLIRVFDARLAVPPELVKLIEALQVRPPPGSGR